VSWFNNVFPSKRSPVKNNCCLFQDPRTYFTEVKTYALLSTAPTTANILVGSCLAPILLFLKTFHCKTALISFRGLVCLIFGFFFWKEVAMSLNGHLCFSSPCPDSQAVSLSLVNLHSLYYFFPRCLIHCVMSPVWPCSAHCVHCSEVTEITIPARSLCCFG